MELLNDNSNNRGVKIFLCVNLSRSRFENEFGSVIRINRKCVGVLWSCRNRVDLTIQGYYQDVNSTCTKEQKIMQ